METVGAATISPAARYVALFTDGNSPRAQRRDLPVWELALSTFERGYATPPSWESRS